MTMRRRLHDLLSLASLLVAACLAALWVRSYLIQDGIQLTTRAGMLSVYSCAGTIAGVWDTELPPMPYSVHRSIDPKPGPIGGGYGRALVTFSVRRVSWRGGTVFMFPHWAALFVAAVWPAVRFIRRRRRRAEPGFPIAAP